MEVLAIILILFAIVVAVALVAARSEQGRAKERLQALTIANVDEMSGIDFEHYAAALLKNEGYTDVKVTTASGDKGVDIVATKDGKRYAIQTKRYKGTVRRGAISDAVAGMVPYGCTASMVITSSRFSTASMEFARAHGCVIVDRDTLADWISRFHKTPEGAATAARATTDALIRGWNARGATELAAGFEASIQAGQATADTVPPEVLRNIKGEAQKQYPNDYAVMEYTIKREVEAYRALQTLSAPDIPSAVLGAVVEKASNEHPTDYSVRLYTIHQQLTAYRSIREFQVDSVPEAILSRIKANAEREYPDEFAVRFYTIQQQVTSYLAVEPFGS